MLAICTPPAAVAQTPPAAFIDAANVVRALIVDMRYAGAHNFVGRPIPGYDAARCWLTQPAGAALGEVARDFAPRGLVLKVFDCYRPARAVASFMRWARDLNDTAGKAEFYPQIDKRTLFRDGYIAARSGHSRGSTVDITLAEAGGRELDMGTPFDFFSPRSSPADPSVAGFARAQSCPARRCNAAPRLPALREGVVAFHAGARTISRNLFRSSGTMMPGSWARRASRPSLPARGGRDRAFTAPDRIS
jgi:D-alanyl-D-alanine dipeptidase